MTNENGTTVPQAASEAGVADPKGKGKAVGTAEQVPHDTTMDEDDDDDEDDDIDEEGDGAEAEDDGMEEIDLDNVIGRRTRGRVIDFAKAAEENPVDDEDDEDDEDDDFVAPEDNKMDEDRMDED